MLSQIDGYLCQQNWQNHRSFEENRQDLIQQYLDCYPEQSQVKIVTKVGLCLTTSLPKLGYPYWSLNQENTKEILLLSFIYFVLDIMPLYQ